MTRWRMALTGMFLAVFAVLALSGPGQFDIVDGKVRYLVARGFLDHGDVDIQDPTIQCSVLPGRGGRRYSQYRLPQSVAGVAAILAADATGPVCEGRRVFFFSLIGAVASGVLAVAYAALFHRLGLGARASLLWGLGGIFCTPSWYYGTSTFDDILGAAAAVVALAIALGVRQHQHNAPALAAGLMLALALHCKQPLGIFVLPVMAAFHDPTAGWRSQGKRLAAVAGALALGVALYLGYEWYRFPTGSSGEHVDRINHSVPTWSSSPLTALVALLISPAAGVFFYNPPLWICLRGWPLWHRSRRLFSLALGAATAIFVLFICSLSFFKGDPAWGPRYLTPVFAVLWIMAPWGFQQMRRRPGIVLLAAGLLVQVAALATDPYRLYLRIGLPMPFYVKSSDLYFHPALSHLLHRPMEIAEVLSPHEKTSIYYRPPYRPAFFLDVLDPSGGAFSGDRETEVIDSLRPWWVSFPAMGASGPPIDILKTMTLFLLIALAGCLLMVVGGREQGRPLGPTGERLSTRASPAARDVQVESGGLDAIVRHSCPITL